MKPKYSTLTQYAAVELPHQPTGSLPSASRCKWSVMIDETTGKLIQSDGSTWNTTTAAAGDLQDAFALGKVITGADEAANAVTIGDGSDALLIYAESGGVIIASSGTSDITIAPDGGDLAVTGNVNISGTLMAGTADAFQVAADGGITCTSLDAGAGTIQTTGDLTVGGTLTLAALAVTTLAVSSLQPATGNLAINGATGATTITIGNLSTGGIIISDNMTIGVDALVSGAIGVTFRAVGQKIYSSTAEQLDIDATTEVEIATATLDIDAATAVTVDTAAMTVTTSGAFVVAAAGASSITATGANLSIVTATSGTLLVSAVAVLDVNVGGNADIDVAGTFDMLSVGAFSIDGTGASNISVTSGNLTASTLTAGNVIVNAVDMVSVIAGANLDVDVTGTVAIDSTGTFSIDGVGNSNVTTATGNLTLATTGTGNIVVVSVGGVDIDAGGTAPVTINTADDATANATATGSITIQAGDKGAGTGDGGSIILIPGGSTGGDAGAVVIGEDASGKNLVWYPGAGDGSAVTFDASADTAIFDGVSLWLGDNAGLYLGDAGGTPDATLQSDGTDITLVCVAGADIYLGPKANGTAGKVVIGDLTVAGESELHIKGDDDSDDDPGFLVLYDHAGADYYLWVDNTGDLRINGTKPVDEDSDGTVVGAQA